MHIRYFHHFYFPAPQEYKERIVSKSIFLKYIENFLLSLMNFNELDDFQHRARVRKNSFLFVHHDTKHFSQKCFKFQRNVWHILDIPHNTHSDSDLQCKSRHSRGKILYKYMSQPTSDW